MKSFILFFLVVCILEATMSAKKKCKNISKDCARKAKNGWCSKNQSYAAMGRKCQKACHMCDSKSEVFDFDARCKRWKDLGYCEADAHSLYMARSCRFSCPELAKEYENSKV